MKVLDMLTACPARIAELTAGLTDAQLGTGPAPGEWSANEVLAHLRSCADVWGGYISKILTVDRPAFRAVSPRTWIRKTDYPQQMFGPSLHAFTSQRNDLLALLEGLTPQEWSRAATVTGASRTQELTVLTYATRLADHEHVHLHQLEEIVAAAENL